MPWIPPVEKDGKAEDDNAEGPAGPSAFVEPSRGKDVCGRGREHAAGRKLLLLQQLLTVDGAKALFLQLPLLPDPLEVQSLVLNFQLLLKAQLMVE